MHAEQDQYVRHYRLKLSVRENLLIFVLAGAAPKSKSQEGRPHD